MSKSSWARVEVLIWVDVIPYYALWMLITYFTNVWNLSFAHAAELVNLFYGMTAIMTVGMQLIVDSFMGNYWMVLFSSFAYTIGLVLLTMSTPPVLSKTTGTCSAYEPQCLGQVQKKLFYIALPLIAVGMAGQLTSVDTFADQQTSPSESSDIKEIHGCWIGLKNLIVSAVVGFALSFIKPWWVLFGISTLCTLGALLTFVTGSSRYNCPKEQDTALTNLFRVFVASASKICRTTTRPGYATYERYDYKVDRISYTPRLRCLDRAATILPSPMSLEQQQNSRWRLCTVTEVEEAKRILCMIPICLNFILIGVVSAIGNTYFVEQANHMDGKGYDLSKFHLIPLPRKLRGPPRHIRFPLLGLLIIHEWSKMIFASATKSFVGSKSKRFARLIAMSMTIAILCCITAASVEARRLDMVKRHDLIDKPNEGIPMNRFWLFPQFVLLGMLNGVKDKTFHYFIVNRVGKPGSRYNPLARAVFGVATICTSFSMYVVAAIKPSWFQATLNRSRLDNYYWTLAAFTAANLVFYVLASYTCWSPYETKTKPASSDETDSESVKGNVDP
ncbi:hypothetical protein M0R45_029007 [Rubus argutus]|uniref:Uncharacterized protein n=1 Tax=Rubus argutus TaxID=59490 RepID=A0AAW1W6X9_RUBAR